LNEEIENYSAKEKGGRRCDGRGQGGEKKRDERVKPRGVQMSATMQGNKHRKGRSKKRGLKTHPRRGSGNIG